MRIPLGPALHLVPIDEFQPGDIGLVVHNGNFPTSRIILVDGGRVATGRFVMRLDGDEPFRIKPVDGPDKPGSDSRLRCIRIEHGSLSLDIPERTDGNSDDEGCLAVCDNGAYITAIVDYRSGDFDPCVVNLATWSMEAHVPRGRSAVFKTWAISHWDESRREMVALMSGKQ